MNSPTTAKGHPIPAVWLSSAVVACADDALSWVAHAARDLLAGVDYASIVTIRRGQIFGTASSTDPVALKADLLQSELEEAPVLAIAGGEPLAECPGDVTVDERPRARRQQLFGDRTSSRDADGSMR